MIIHLVHCSLKSNMRAHVERRVKVKAKLQRGKKELDSRSIYQTHWTLYFTDSVIIMTENFVGLKIA